MRAASGLSVRYTSSRPVCENIGVSIAADPPHCHEKGRRKRTEGACFRMELLRSGRSRRFLGILKEFDLFRTSITGGSRQPMRPMQPRIALLLIAAFAAAFLGEGAARAQTSAVLATAKEQLADRDWRAAIKTLEAVAAAEKGKPGGLEASFLIAKAALSANDFAAALAGGEAFLRDYPDS